VARLTWFSLPSGLREPALELTHILYLLFVVSSKSTSERQNSKGFTSWVLVRATGRLVRDTGRPVRDKGGLVRDTSRPARDKDHPIKTETPISRSYRDGVALLRSLPRTTT